MKVRARSFKSAINSAAVQQLFILLLATSILDGGRTAQTCLFALLAFWIFVALVRFQRRVAPTVVDMLMIEAGYLPLCLFSFFLSHVIWQWRGAT